MPTPKRYLPSPLKALLLLVGLAIFTALVIQSCTRQEGPPRIGSVSVLPSGSEPASVH